MRERMSASQACGSTPFILAVTIRLYMAAARCPPRSDPQNSHDFLPRAMPRSPLSAALLERHPADPSVTTRVITLMLADTQPFSAGTEAHVCDPCPKTWFVPVPFGGRVQP